MAERSSEASDVTQKALFGIDGGWYQDYWYGEHRDAKPRMLTRWVGSIGEVIAIGRIWRSTTLLQDAAAKPIHAQQDLLVANKG